MPRVLLSFASDCARQVRKLLAAGAPCFISRLGGSDTDLIVDFFTLTRSMSVEAALERLGPQIKVVQRYNGYYDKNGTSENVQRYCHVMQQAYTGCPEVFLVGSTWLSAYLPESINQQFREDVGDKRRDLEQFLRVISPPFLRLYPYSFMERILHGDTLFRVFATALQGKRVLVICPFARSIRANFARREEFFPGYTYPDFTLQTVNTPITYAGLPAEFYPHANWFDTLAALQSEIMQHEFDIALLACGSYAMPLGRFIADHMHRQAIYVGGVLQLYFGIMGRRYENPFFLSQIARDKFIYPLERETILRHVEIRADSAKEALGAYF